MFVMQSILLRKSDPTWNRFYDPNISYITYNQSQYINSTTKFSFFVDEVIFENFSPNGVIRITDGRYRKTYILISKSFFSNSYSIENGGSIHAYSNGVLIQYRVCSINSTTKRYGGHSYSDDVDENHIIECSFSKGKAFDGCIYQFGGIPFFYSTNVSYANCRFYSALSNAFTHHDKHKFNSFFNNSGLKCLYYDTREINMTYINIISNYGEDAIFGYYGFHRTNIRFIAFISNTGKYLITRTPWWHAYDCFLKDNNVQSISEGGQDVFFETNYVLDLRQLHLSTYKCHAVHPFDMTSPINKYINENKKLKMFQY